MFSKAKRTFCKDGRSRQHARARAFAGYYTEGNNVLKGKAKLCKNGKAVSMRHASLHGLLYRRYNVLKGKAKALQRRQPSCFFEVIITRFPLAGNAFFCKETLKRRLLRMRTGGQRSGGRCFGLWGRILRSSELFESMYMKWSLRNFPIYAEHDEPAQPKNAG